MTDLIHFVQIPNAIIMIDDVEFKTVMFDGGLVHFSSPAGHMQFKEKELIMSTYHGSGRWKVRRKIHGQTVAKHYFKVLEDGKEKEIQARPKYEKSSR